MKKIIITCQLCILAVTAFGQQDPTFTHYAFNTLNINPGYAGSREALTASLLHRSQWVGFKGAPLTQLFSIHTPFFAGKMGIGLSAINDRIGPVNNTSITADYAYKIKVNEKATLSMGIKAGINFLQADLNSLEANDQDDGTIANNVRNLITPNVGVGFYYSTAKWYAGISAPRLIENKINKNNMSSSTAQERNHYYAVAGLVFNLTPTLKFRPTGFLKVTPNAPVQGDVTGMFIFDDLFEIGAMYRSGDAFGALVGVNINSQCRIGYSFDWSYGINLNRANAGSHEIMVRYDFVRKVKDRVISPRYF